MRPELRSFLQSWINWIDAGAPDCEPYERKDSLCFAVPDLLCQDMSALLKENFGKGDASAFPFGDGTTSDFYLERHNNAAYQNEKRIAWVRKQLEQAA